MKKILLLFSLLVTLLVSCDSHHFKIEGDIKGVGGPEVRIIYPNDSVIVDEIVALDKKGHFAYQGSSPLPVVAVVADVRGNLLTSLVVADGERLKVKGDASQPMGLKIKGSKVNEDWQLFRKEHAAFYADANPSRLDAAIEKYVSEHPADLLSTVLLMHDYGNFTDRDKVQRLLDAIQATARPESLTAAFARSPMGKARSITPRLMSLTLVEKGKKEFEQVNLTGRITLINCWGNPAGDRQGLINKLQTIDASVSVVDVLTEGDTLKWHRTTADDPSAWRHYWAPGGPVEQGLQLLHITSLPWYAVTDSTGLVTYNGPDLAKALKAAKAP